MLSRCITHPLKYSSFSPCLVKVVGCRFSYSNETLNEIMLKSLKNNLARNSITIEKLPEDPKTIVENKEVAQLVHKSAIELVNLEKSFEEGNVCCFFISFYFIMN